MSEKKEKVIATSKDISFDPQAFDKLFKKLSVSASEGGRPQPMRKRRVKFTIYKTMCRPDTFPSDIQLTLEELSASDEEQVLSNLPANSGEKSMGIALAKKALIECNGRRLRPHEVDMVWDAIGFAGRLATADCYVSHCTGAEEATLKNSLLSAVIE